MYSFNINIYALMLMNVLELTNLTDAFMITRIH